MAHEAVMSGHQGIKKHKGEFGESFGGKE